MVQDTTATPTTTKLEGHPIELLIKLAKKLNLDLNSKEFAVKLDESNLWPSYRERFFYPKIKDLPKGDYKKNCKNILFLT
jgi:hypothetical protein